jgi:hypothetical protein
MRVLLFFLYLAALLVFGIFWMIAVPVYAMTAAMEHIRLKFKRFEVMLDRKMDELWAGIL